VELHPARARRAADDLKRFVDVETVALRQHAFRLFDRDARLERKLEPRDVRALGLERVGVQLAPDGAVVVDRYSRSSVESIHAIGDVTNRINLTPVATAEAMWLARTLFRGEPTPVDHENVPTAVFANPNLATVGLSEEKARERYGAVDIYKTYFRPLKLTLTEKKERVFMKLVVDQASQRVVGAHMIGPDAGEIIQGIAIAVKLGATKAQFDATIGIHPTVAEEFVTMRDKAS
jgi:glutathione reductase (NADPH)